jgi:glucan phosphorylase
LLDTNIPKNTPGDRDVTVQLYGGDQDMRIRQRFCSASAATACWKRWG